MSSRPEGIVAFPPFSFDLRSGELRKNGRKLKLHPQPAKVLTILLRRAGEVARREVIQKEVWGDDTFVAFDLGINSCIRQIRTALGDDADQPRFVETVPREGYRFVAPVATAEPDPKASPRRGRVALTTLALGVGAGLAFFFFLRSGGDPLSSRIRVRPVTSFPGLESYAAISPDGEKVAYSWNGGEGRAEHLYVQLIDGSEPLRLTNENRRDYSPAWSPDGRQIAFLREIREPGQAGFSEIRAISALGGKETRLGTAAVRFEVGPLFVSGLDWSPDGNYLVFSDKESTDEREGVFLLSIQTGEKRRLSAPPPAGPPVRDHQPAFSPDGSTVAFVRGGSTTKYQILLHDLEGKEARLLATEDGQVLDLDWMPEGSALVYARDRWDERGLTRVSVPDGRTSDLSSSGGAISVSASTDGERLAFTQDDGVLLNIWRAAGPASEIRGDPVKLMPSSRADFSPEYSPDGSQIAFTSRRSGWQAVWVCDSNGKGCAQIGGDNSSMPRWSPDGKKIGYAVRDDGITDLYFTSLERGFTRRLTEEAGVGFSSLAWSPDGLTIYYASNQTGEYNIWRRSLESTDAIPLTRSGGRNPRVSPDGKYVYYPKPRPEAAYKWVDVWKVPVEGGEEVPVLTGRLLEGPNWVLWRDALIYRAWSSEYGQAFINVHHLTTGEESQLLTFDAKEQAFGYGLSVSPDGMHILYSKAEPRNSDIVLIENFR
jgi:Tol biopolymer transport system component/DNA-binding winged helix-turn-helix (wHTH) protein